MKPDKATVQFLGVPHFTLTSSESDHAANQGESIQAWRVKHMLPDRSSWIVNAAGTWSVEPRVTRPIAFRWLRSMGCTKFGDPVETRTKRPSILCWGGDAITLKHIPGVGKVLQAPRSL